LGAHVPARNQPTEGNIMPTITLKRSAATLAVMAGLLAGAAPANAAGPAGIPGTAGLNDALTAARFSLAIDGVEIGQFSEVVGINSGVEPVEREPPTVTLKRGKNKDLSLFAWHQSVAVFDAVDVIADVEGWLGAARNSCTLTMYATDGTATAKYYLESAWPSKVEISGLRAGTSEVLYETVTLTVDDIQRMET
jgi:phage tail-like protein